MRKVILFPLVFVILLAYAKADDEGAPKMEIFIDSQSEAVFDIDGNHKMVETFIYRNIGPSDGHYNPAKMDYQSEHSYDYYWLDDKPISKEELYSQGFNIYPGQIIKVVHEFAPLNPPCQKSAKCFKWRFNITISEDENLSEDEPYTKTNIPQHKLLVKIPKYSPAGFKTLSILDIKPSRYSEHDEGKYKVFLWDEYFIDKLHVKEFPEIYLEFDYILDPPTISWGITFILIGIFINKLLTRCFRRMTLNYKGKKRVKEVNQNGKYKPRFESIKPKHKKPRTSY